MAIKVDGTAGTDSRVTRGRALPALHSRPIADLPSESASPGVNARATAPDSLSGMINTAVEVLWQKPFGKNVIDADQE